MAWVLTEDSQAEASRRWVLHAGSNLLGSSPDAQILIEHPSVSRRHAMIYAAEDRVEIEDLGSRNGTFLGNKRLSSRRVIHAQSMLAFGQVSALLSRSEDRDVRPAAIFTLGEPTGEGADEGSGPPSELHAGSTLGLDRVEKLLFDQLPGLVRELGRMSRGDMARRVGACLAEVLPCFELEILARGPRSAVLFRYDPSGTIARPHQLTDGAAEVAGAHLIVRGRFLSGAVAGFYRPALELALELVESAGRCGGVDSSEPDASTAGRAASGAAERPLATDRSSAPAMPQPPSVSDAVKRIYRDATTVARGRVAVLILGESGTGKEVLARYIHRASGRGRLVTLNCAALPKELLEAELFGIEAGVATGVTARPGKFELAHGGTLFLDEIADMDLSTQARILRVLQEGELHRIGSLEARPARARIVAATNRDLESMVASGEFRGDLYHRISDWVVELPPLRRRRVDIPNLAAYFLAGEGRRQGKTLAGISEAALAALEACDWPGNIRQLEREIARSTLFLESGFLLDTSRLSPHILAPPAPRPGEHSLKEALERLERREIVIAVQRAGGDTAIAAERLGIGRSTLYRRMKELDVQLDGWLAVD